MMSDLGTLGGGYESFAYDINDSGQTVGWSWVDGYSLTRAFLYSGGVMSDLGAGDDSFAYGINNSGQVVGKSRGNAFLYSDGTFSNLSLGGEDSWAQAINNRGQVTGSSQIAPGEGTYHAFLYGDGTMLDLGTLGGSFGSHGYGLNEKGQVVGFSFSEGNADYHAFLYSDGKMIDVNPSGWYASIATGINDRGQIVGYGISPSGYYRSFLLTPVPEPASLVLLLALLTLGMAGTTLRAWRH